MIEELASLIERWGRDPSIKEINETLSNDAKAYKTTFGNLRKAIPLAEEFKSSSSTHNKKSIYLAPLPQSKSTRRRYGKAIDFRGLRYAPINENGVIFLFGMLAEELGFVVESVQNGFPDCDAKRKLEDGT